MSVHRVLDLKLTLLPKEEIFLFRRKNIASLYFYQ